MSRIFPFFLIAALLAAPAAGQSESPLAGAIAAGQVGERYDGYMGFASSPSPQLRRQVYAINIRRRNLYLELASRRNVTAELVGMATACQLFKELPVGEAYLLNDNVWRRRSSGQQIPLPDYCH
jgi:uncharacterized protein YdbL (DUF1318 family)